MPFLKLLPLNVYAGLFVLAAFLSFNIADAFLKQASTIYSFAEAALYPVLAYGILLIIASGFTKTFAGLTQIHKTQHKKLHVIRAFCGTGCFFSFVLAIQFITFAKTYTLLLTAPLWVAVLSIFFFKEKIGIHRWTAILVGFAGVLIVLRPGIITLSWASLLVLSGALSLAVFLILTRKIGAKEPMINMVLFPIITDCIVFLPIILWMGNWTPPQIEHFALFAASGFFYLMGTTFSAVGFSRGDSSMLAPLQYSQIIWGTIIGLIIFNEIPEKWTIIGATVIILSGVYLFYREHKAHKSLT
ncbi:MAG: DMT family transporter [Alphaproteobacteria bacterium]|nr:DMT family transporter [Alphaproteobacteria bacterium]NCQ87865.1 DMT family transporter [Alphaproteobacteria bacterium]NCT05627.1 DMT family transporter [Alphaproteobacteria bacterium]